MMQADKHGSPVEQRRANANWIPASMRQSHPEYVPNRRCRSCTHCAKYTTYRCQKHGFSTAANAVCIDFHPRAH